MVWTLIDMNDLIKNVENTKSKDQLLNAVQGLDDRMWSAYGADIAIAENDEELEEARISLLNELKRQQVSILTDEARQKILDLRSRSKTGYLVKAEDFHIIIDTILLVWDEVENIDRRVTAIESNKVT